MRVLSILFSCISFFGLCQKSPSQEELKHIISPLTNRAKDLPGISIYLSTDKDIYETHEDIWFNALIYRDNVNVNPVEDKIFILKLLDNAKNIVSSAKYEVKDGQVNGHLYVSDSLPQGNYLLTGYTSSSLVKERMNYRTLKPIEIRKNILPNVIVDYKNSSLYEESHQAELSVYKRSGGPLANSKFKIIGMSDGRKSTLTKGQTDEEGKSSINFNLPKEFDSYSLEVSLDSKQIESVPLSIKRKDSAVILDFFPEGGHLLSKISQKVGFTARNTEGAPVIFRGVLTDGKKVLDTLKSTSRGIGSFLLSPEPARKYDIRPLGPSRKLRYELPQVKKSGTTVQVQHLSSEKLVFQIYNYSQEKHQKKIYVRIQSRGIVLKMLRGFLNKGKKTVTLPLNDIDPGILEISVYDENYLPVASRLVFIKPEKGLQTVEKSELKRSYKTRSKVVVDLKVIDQRQLSGIVNANVSVFDKLYQNDINGRTMESFYMMENEIDRQIIDAKSYFNQDAGLVNELDMLMLTTKPHQYRWSDDRFVSDSKRLVIEGDIHGRVYTKSGKSLDLLKKETSLQLFCSLGVFQVVTDSLGAFTIDKDLLIQLRGEKVFLKSLDPNVVIQMIDSEKSILDKVNLSHPLAIKRQNVRKEKITKEKLTYLSLNSMNFLDEVIMTASRDSRPKGKQLGAQFLGTNSDYVCRQYGILNCENHQYGYKPIDGQRYKLNNGQTVIYRQSFAETELKSKNALKNYVTVETLYPLKIFEEKIYAFGEMDEYADFRKTLYWKPSLKSNENGELRIEFYTSDMRGAFTGEIDLYSEDGRFGHYNFDFMVY